MSIFVLNSMETKYNLIRFMLALLMISLSVKSEGVIDNKMDKIETATFGAGCFWGVESVFKQTKGVVETSVGFMGGKLENPSYRNVCYDNTGHAEVCQVKFNPDKISYLELVKLFFETHDPTQVNRQGPDIGDQYRSAIFYHNENQRMIAENAISKIEKAKVLSKSIATEVTEAAAFYPAEEYHQDYYSKKGIAPHCAIGLNVDFDFLLSDN